VCALQIQVEELMSIDVVTPDAAATGLTTALARCPLQTRDLDFGVRRQIRANPWHFRPTRDDDARLDNLATNGHDVPSWAADR